MREIPRLDLMRKAKHVLSRNAPIVDSLSASQLKLLLICSLFSYHNIRFHSQHLGSEEATGSELEIPVHSVAENAHQGVQHCNIASAPFCVSQCNCVLLLCA